MFTYHTTHEGIIELQEVVTAQKKEIEEQGRAIEELQVKLHTYDIFRESIEGFHDRATRVLVELADRNGITL